MQTTKDISDGRAHSIIRDVVSRFLLEEANTSPLITVVYVQINKTGRAARVYCSVVPNEDSEKVLAFLERKTALCQKYIRKHSSLRIVPMIYFAIAKDAKRIP